MSTAEATRDAIRRQPFLLHALRAGVLNYTAAASFLAVGGDDDAVATALRRFAAELPAYETASRDARVTMHSGVGLQDGAEPDSDPLLQVGGTVVTDGGSSTAVLATGPVEARDVGTVCARFDAEDIDLQAAAVAGDSLIVVVSRRDGPRAVQTLEDVLTELPA